MCFPDDEDRPHYRHDAAGPEMKAAHMPITAPQRRALMAWRNAGPA